MIIFLTVLHVVICLFLIVVVLLQSGKAADLAGAFGGMGSQTAFGPRGAATVLTKATTTAAVLFMLTSIWLGIEQGRQRGTGQSVIERTGSTSGGPETAPAPAPSTPAVETVPVSPDVSSPGVNIEQPGSGQAPATSTGSGAGQTSGQETPQPQQQ